MTFLRIYFLVIAGLFMSNCNLSRQEFPLQYNGVYSSHWKLHGYKNAMSHIEFHPDSTVATLSTINGRDDLRELLKFAPQRGTGRFKKEHNRISFESESPEGKVEYHGEIVDSNTIMMEMHSLINGRTSKAEYIFEPFK